MNDELIVLRISVARIAQALGLDNDLRVTDKNYTSLASLAEHQDRGWNDLAGRIHDHVRENRTCTGSHMRMAPIGRENKTLAAPLVAARFVQILGDYLTSAQWEEMLDRNLKENLIGICHSHDFCDANMAMEEAFHSLGLATGADIDLESYPHLESAHEAACELWNEAWETAMPALTRQL